MLKTIIKLALTIVGCILLLLLMPAIFVGIGALLGLASGVSAILGIVLALLFPGIIVGIWLGKKES